MKKNTCSEKVGNIGCSIFVVLVFLSIVSRFCSSTTDPSPSISERVNATMSAIPVNPATETPTDGVSLHDGMTLVAGHMTQTAEYVPQPVLTTVQPKSNTFESICKSPDESNLTDVQMEQLALSYTGVKLNGWSGEVYDVRYDEYGFYGKSGTYAVMISMQPDSFIFSRNVILINLDASVADLSVHQVITFGGIVKLVETSFNVMCNPITVENVTITR